MENDIRENDNTIFDSIVLKGSTPYEAPIGEIEEELARIWSSVLKIETIGRNDNLFEMGGNSLQASRIINLIFEVFGMELPIRTIFELQTIKALAQKIEDTYNEVLGEEMEEGMI